MASVSSALRLAILLVPFLLWGGTAAVAQEEGRITGQVVGAESEEPLVGATVALWAESETDSTLVAGTATGPDGTFTLEGVPAERNVLRVSYVGYEERRFPNTQPTPTGTDLGTIRLASRTTRAEVWRSWPTGRPRAWRRTGPSTTPPRKR